MYMVVLRYGLRVNIPYSVSHFYVLFSGTPYYTNYKWCVKKKHSYGFIFSNCAIYPFSYYTSFATFSEVTKVYQYLKIVFTW